MALKSKKHIISVGNTMKLRPLDLSEKGKVKFSVSLAIRISSHHCLDSLYHLAFRIDVSGWVAGTCRMEVLP